MSGLRFTTPELLRQIASAYGTPSYVYGSAQLKENAVAALNFPAAYGLTVRYAMKAAPNASILRVFDRAGLHIDASSGFEVRRALKAGIAAEKISLSTQEFPDFFPDLHEAGIHFNACSLDQISRFGELYPGSALGIRVNPGLGSGGTAKTNVGGPSSSFGIWHESLDQADLIIEKYRLKVVRVHTHIGSGSDPAVWQKTADLSLGIVERYKDVESLNLGGGYKVGRMPNEISTDLEAVGAPVKQAFERLAKATGRRIRLEIEPGTFLVANASVLVSKIQDKVSTGEQGYSFIKLDAGMTELLRPSLYGAQHPIIVLPQKDSTETEACVVVGHCCESGDLLSPKDGEPEVLGVRELAQSAIGDLCVIEGVGAYCSSMSTINYNSFPQAAEVIIDDSGEPQLIRERQTLEQILQNEIMIDL